MLTARITNFACTGSELVREGQGQASRLIPITLEGADWRILVDRDYIRGDLQSELKGRNVATATIEVPTATRQQEDQWKERLLCLCDLLGFALESRVGVCALSWDDGAGSQMATMGSIQTFRPVFSTGAEIKGFVEQVFPSYVALKGPRALNVVVDYLWNASLSGLALETKLLTLFVLLENLKHTWAHSRGFPMIRGYFRLPGATPTNPGRKQTFKELLDGMYSEVGMPATPQQIISLRNEIIHSGLLGINVQDKIQLWERMVGLHREYLLRLLGYVGPFYDFTTNGMRQIQ